MYSATGNRDDGVKRLLVHTGYAETPAISVVSNQRTGIARVEDVFGSTRNDGAGRPCCKVLAPSDTRTRSLIPDWLSGATGARADKQLLSSIDPSTEVGHMLLGVGNVVKEYNYDRSEGVTVAALGGTVRGVKPMHRDCYMGVHSIEAAGGVADALAPLVATPIDARTEKGCVNKGVRLGSSDTDMTFPLPDGHILRYSSASASVKVTNAFDTRREVDIPVAAFHRTRKLMRLTSMDVYQRDAGCLVYVAIAATADGDWGNTTAVLLLNGSYDLVRQYVCKEPHHGYNRRMVSKLHFFVHDALVVHLYAISVDGLTGRGHSMTLRWNMSAVDTTGNPDALGELSGAELVDSVDDLARNGEHVTDMNRAAVNEDYGIFMSSRTGDPGTRRVMFTYGGVDSDETDSDDDDDVLRELERLAL